MAVGLASGIANAILNALCSSTPWSEPAGFFVQFHTGDPGAAGTSNAAGETRRLAVTFAAASAGAVTNSASVTLTGVSTTETYTHVSFWSADPAGTFLGSDQLADPAGMIVGRDFTMEAGEIDLSLAPVAV